jgi:hypothetical protein
VYKVIRLWRTSNIVFSPLSLYTPPKIPPGIKSVNEKGLLGGPGISAPFFLPFM